MCVSSPKVSESVQLSNREPDFSRTHARSHSSLHLARHQLAAALIYNRIIFLYFFRHHYHHGTVRASSSGPESINRWTRIINLPRESCSFTNNNNNNDKSYSSLFFFLARRHNDFSHFPDRLSGICPPEIGLLLH